MTPLLLTLAMLHGCDAASTSIGLQRGAREVNPVLGHHVVMNVGLQTAFTTAQVVALKTLHTRHPKWAKAFTVLAMSVEGAIVVHNIQQLRGQR